MAYEQRDNSGSLFKNDRKQTEKHPDYTGSIRIKGTDFHLAAWLKQSKTGKKYMSVSIGKQVIKGAERAGLVIFAISIMLKLI